MDSFLEVFALVFLAEFGDKSQLIAMTLAARHRASTVVLGAVAAFALLNLMAVLVGGALAQWLPQWVIALVVGLLFLWFGWQAITAAEEDEDAPDVHVGARLLISVFLLIFMAELGDKTQLAVAAMGGINPAVPTWAGATVALFLTTLLGVVFGAVVLKRLPMHWLHRGSGVLFMVFAVIALYSAYQWFSTTP